MPSSYPARARIEYTEYDNWNGGTYIYTLMLEVPVVIFAALESKLPEIKSGISSKLATICSDLTNHLLNSVSITPSLSKPSNFGHRAKPADAEVKHIWKEGFFRLFLSHVSAHKVTVAKLKGELRLRGIAAFVAHEDSTPSLEWQNEIELALRSMHALVALLTDDFHYSSWTDQEVGYALGRNAPVIPVCLGAKPYGFMSKIQAVKGSLAQPEQAASLLLTTVLNNFATRRYMRKGWASAFEVASSFASAKELGKIISTVKDFADDEKAQVLRACKENDQVFKAGGVVSRVCSALGVAEPGKVIEGDGLPF